MADPDFGYRCGQADVENIIDFDPSINDLTPFIEVANQLVTEICASIGKYNAARLKTIEMWLAAHFIAVRDPRYQSETIGAASATRMNGQMGMNLSLTPYGQQVLLLDTAGGLAQLDAKVSRGKRFVPGILHLGDRCKLDRWAYSPWRRLWEGL